MRNTVIRLIYGAVLFVATVFVLELLTHQRTTAVTADMAAAALPVVSMKTVGKTVNELHGFVSERDEAHFRAPITPAGEDRQVSFIVNSYGKEPGALSFELRTIDGERLIEEGEITDRSLLEDGRTEASFSFKDLIEKDTEYMLVLLLSGENAEPVRYYTRLVECDETAVSEELAFAQRFHDDALSGGGGGTVRQVIETSAEGDNSSFAEVTIHSDLAQVTYGDLAPTELVPPVTAITDLQSETCMLQMDYILSIAADGGNVKLRCTEYYRLRRGTDRVYLIDYHRTMEQVLDPELKQNYASDLISLGIVRDVQFMESDGGSACAFVNAGRLYAVTPSSSELTQVFAFGEPGTLDERENFQNYGIRILDVDETGAIDFLVYGYMNRGEHEGEIGAAVYSYNGEYHTVEETAFIPYGGSYELLRAQAETLSYYNTRNSTLFLLLNETIYEVNTAAHTVQAAADRLRADSLQVSSSGQMVAWKSEDRGRGDAADRITVMNFATSNSHTIEAPAGERVVPLGFIGEDLIYGSVRESDVTTGALGEEVLPLYAVRIVDSALEVVEHYEAEGYYVTSCEVKDGQITLHRATKSASDGQYVPAEDDQILASSDSEEGTNRLTQTVTERYETQTFISMRGFRAAKVRYLRSKLVLHEGSRRLTLPDSGQTQPERYYVYSVYGLEGQYLLPAKAVEKAEALSGVVLDDTGRYVWIYGNRRESNQIMAITADRLKPELGSVAACLDLVFQFESAAASAEQALEGSGNLLQILEEAVPGARSYNLAGCSLNAVLYYVSREKPVLALYDGGSRAALIVGYNNSIVVVIDPESGSMERMNRSAAEEKFTPGGSYVCYREAGD